MRYKKIVSALVAFSMVASSVLVLGDGQVKWDDIMIANAKDTATNTHIEYRYAIKSYVTSETELSEPWIYDSESISYTDYGDWSEYQETPIDSSELREVDTKTESRSYISGYYMFYYCTQEASSPHNRCYRNYSVGENWAGYGARESYGEWHNYWADPASVDALNNTATVAPGEWFDGAYSGYNRGDDYGYNFGDGYLWFKGEPVTSSYDVTLYRYRERSKTTTYIYYRLSDFSEWSTTPIADSDNIVVETRTVEDEVETTEPTTEPTPGIVLQNNTIIIGSDNFSFLNNINFFNSSYNLSDTMLEVLNTEISNLEWGRITEKLNDDTKWTGSCYGMASVEILTKAGVLSAKDIESNAETLFELDSPKNNDKVEDIITYYHMLQHSKIFVSQSTAYMRKGNKERITELISMAESVPEGGVPVLVCFNYTTKASGKRLDGGHAVVAYGVEYGAWTYSGGTYDCRILISDPNVSDFDATTCIYINTETYKWEIPYYQDKYYSCTNNNQNTKDNPYAQIRFATNDIHFIDMFGFATNSTASKSATYDSTICIDSADSDFGVAYYDTKSGDINDSDCELMYYSELSDGEGTENKVNAILPTADVAYEYFEKSTKPFETSVEYTNSMMNARVSNGSYAIYKPDESVEFSGENSDYTLSMVLNEDYYPTDWYQVEINGYNSESAKLSVCNDGYIISGDALENGVFITASNRKSMVRFNLMTNYDSVLIYEKANKTLAAKIDTDYDGIYESDFVPEYIGDITQDNNVGVIDVVALQKYLLNQNSISATQYISSDLNTDGNVDVFDLALLKRTVLDS